MAGKRVRHEKEATGQFSVTLPKTLVATIDQIAKRDGTSRAGVIGRAARELVRRDEVVQAVSDALPSTI